MTKEQQLIELLKKYESWEAKLILEDECWETKLPCMNQDLFEEFLELQAERVRLLYD